MAGVTGLEPAASGVTGRRSNQLSYTPVLRSTASAAGSKPGCKDGVAAGPLVYCTPLPLSR
jgi:hypothetical protein